MSEGGSADAERRSPLQRGLARGLDAVDAMPPSWRGGSLALLFLVSRAAAWSAGVRFDSGTLDWFWQFLDPTVLREDLLRSAFYCHIQPPGFNFFMGLVLKLAPGYEDAVFATLYTALGAATACGLYRLMRALRVSAGIAWLITAGTIVSPTAILYESWLFYDLPMMGLTILAALSLLRFARSEETRWLVLFAGCTALMCLSRSMYHLYYAVGMTAVVALWGGPWRARLVKASGVAVLLVTALFLKNLIVFGGFFGSSWMGAHTLRMARYTLGYDELKRLHDEGAISQLATVRPFSPLSKYPEEFRDPGAFADVPALARETKPAGGPNFNHVGYLEISRQIRGDAFALMARAPRGYAFSQVRAWYRYWRPATVAPLVHENREAIRAWAEFWDRWVLGRMDLGINIRGEAPDIFLLLVASNVVALVSVVRSLRARGKPRFDAAERLTLAYMLASIAYVTAIGNLLEFSETYRYRYYVAPFYAVLIGLALERWIARPTSGRTRVADARDAESR